MNDDIRQRRRQAAWFCFEPHLSEEELLEAIELLEQRFQLDGVGALISYVTLVCTQFNIHKDIGKSLCVKFFEVMAHKNIELPNDPLLLIEEKRLNLMRQQELQAANAKAKEEAVPPVEEVAAHSMVFMCMLKQIIKEVFADELALIKLLKLCCEQDKKINKELKVAIESWGQNPQNLRWVLPFSEQRLAEFTHLLYVCVCEAAGPVQADQVFHKAIAVCEQRPEARKFSPSRLL
jgi:hypothetical protein